MHALCDAAAVLVRREGGEEELARTYPNTADACRAHKRFSTRLVSRMLAFGIPTARIVQSEDFPGSPLVHHSASEFWGSSKPQESRA